MHETLLLVAIVQSQIVSVFRVWLGQNRIISIRVTGQMCLRLVYWTTEKTTQAMLLDV